MGAYTDARSTGSVLPNVLEGGGGGGSGVDKASGRELEGQAVSRT